MKKELITFAFTNSEYTSVDVVVVNLSTDLITLVKDTYKIIKGFPKDFEFYTLTKFYADFEFGVDWEGKYKLDGAEFITRDVDLNTPIELMEDIDAKQIVFNTSGFSFLGYDENSGDEFYTTYIPYSALDNL